MNMYGMKDEGLLVLVLLATVVVSVVGSLTISQEVVIQKPDSSFSVMCRDEAGRSVQWRGPNGPLGPKTRPKVQVKSLGTVMVFDQVVLKDNGTYTCRTGSEHKEFHLFVADYKTGGLNISLESATKGQNESLFVGCYDSFKLPINWRGPRGALNQHSRPNVLITSYGPGIAFKDIQLEDSGIYTCSNGFEEKKFQLTVVDELKFMDTPTEQTGIQGQDATLRCEVRGGTATWTVEGSDLSDKKKYKIIADGLVVKNLHWSDPKNYICKAVQGPTGKVNERKIHLRIKHKPEFIHKMYEAVNIVYGYINGTVNLTCIVTSDPPSTFEWRKSGDRSQKIGKIINETENVSIMQLHVDETTFGEYKCIATNVHGRLEMLFSLLEGARPHPPKTVSLKGANSNLLILTIDGQDLTEVKQGMNVSGFRVEYRADGEEKWHSKDFELMAEDNNYRLEDLHHNTEYDIRVASRNAAGLSEFTNITTYRTLTSQGDGSHPHGMPLFGDKLMILVGIVYLWFQW